MMSSATDLLYNNCSNTIEIFILFVPMLVFNNERKRLFIVVVTKLVIEVISWIPGYTIDILFFKS